MNALASRYDEWEERLHYETIPSALAMLQPGFIIDYLRWFRWPENQLFLENQISDLRTWTTNGKEGSEGLSIDLGIIASSNWFNYIFHLEDDFIFNENQLIYITLIAVMERNYNFSKCLFSDNLGMKKKRCGGIMQLSSWRFYWVFIWTDEMGRTPALFHN